VSLSNDPGEERLASLEQRVAELERRLRSLTAGGTDRPAEAKAASAPPAAPVQRLFPPTLLPAREPIDLEQLLGGKGLLVIGVVALLTAAGLFLRYAFEQGWVAPWVRVLGALVLGVAIAVAGERQIVRGLRRFGLAMVGAGGGLAYLGLWAAAGPYDMVPRGLGVLLAAATSAAVAWRSVAHDSEPLALWALLGAFLAPLLLPAPGTRPEALLAYLAVVGAAAGSVAVRRTWRAALDAALAGSLIIAASVVPDSLHTAGGFVFVTAAGIGAVAATRGRTWPEARLAGLLLPWLLLMMHAATSGLAESVRWLAVAAGAALLVAEWWTDRSLVPLRNEELDLTLTPDVFAFAAAPVAFVFLCRVAEPPLPAAAAGLPAAAAALLYLGVGMPKRWAPFVAAGLGLIALALARQFDGAAVAASWSAVVVAAAAVDRRLDQRAGAGVAVVLAALTGAQLFTVGLAARPRGEAAFADLWTIALFALVAAAAVAAASWRERPGLPAWLRRGRDVLWALAGAALFGGISLELRRFFEARSGTWPAARLAGDLSISLWWLAYAGATMRLGFALRNGAVRWAGLGVAGLAVGKIALYDLSRLSALYRVGSVFVLALLALAVAYAYNRRSHVTS